MRKFLDDMTKEDLLRTWDWIRKHLINKYLITLLVFAVVLTFCGSQSLISRIGMRHDIREKEAELREYQEKIAETEQNLRALDNPDSLERFAREHYYMRTEGEDVYLIKE